MKVMKYYLYIFVSLLLALGALPLSSAAAARSLALGDSGADVTTVQNGLITLGYLGASYNSGYFGSLTQTALKKFQCAKNIICAGASVDGYGVYGPKTQAAMQIALAPKQPATVTGSMTAAATGKFEVSGWLPYWRIASSTTDVGGHLAQMTSVMPFGYVVQADGSLADPAHLGQEPWTSFIKAAKALKVRVVPTVMWGDGTQEQAILSDTTKRIALENRIARMVVQNGYDGVDIDFEAKQAQTINYFSTFLKGLYTRTGNKWVYCTVEARMPLEDRYPSGTSVPPDATDYANNFIAMNQYCDRVEIMAYDQGTVDKLLDSLRPAPYAPVADTGWDTALVKLAAQTISRNKLILGIPTYGYEYAVTPSATSASGVTYKRLWAFNPPYATNIVQELNAQITRTSADEAGFVYDPNALAAVAPTDGNIVQTQQTQPDGQPSATSVVTNNGTVVSKSGAYNFVTWSDAQAIGDKITLAHNLGLRGVAFFSLNGSEDPGMWSLLPTLH
ncbi:MAG: peptidoglycan-binding protein [Patescibacteria group bacterium]|nr:peptidoglycan-binding protein [Patescibacteria group bacterium]